MDKFPSGMEWLKICTISGRTSRNNLQGIQGGDIPDGSPGRILGRILGGILRRGVLRKTLGEISNCWRTPRETLRGIKMKMPVVILREIPEGSAI